MLTQDQLPTNAIVSFELYPAQIIGVGYQNAKIMGVFNADTAGTWIDTAVLHAQIYPTLPSGVPNNHDGYDYVRLLLPSGEKTVIGIPWIRDSSLVVADSRRLQLTIDNVSSADLARIQIALSANNFTIADSKWV